jgi:hypothetical protein
MANQDDGLLREVEEELRRERLEKLWQQYGTYFIAAAVFVVLAVLGYKYWENSRMAAAEKAGARYEDALTLATQGKQGSATKEFENLAADGPAGYRTLSRLQLAGALVKEGKKTEALAPTRRWPTTPWPMKCCAASPACRRGLCVWARPTLPRWRIGSPL